MNYVLHFQEMWAAEAQFGNHRQLFTNITDVRDTLIPTLSYFIRPHGYCEPRYAKKMMGKILKGGQNVINSVLQEIGRQPGKLAVLKEQLKLANHGFHPMFF